MKNITITNESVIINFGGKTYKYHLNKGSFTVTDEQVQEMPAGVKVIFIFLAAAKKVRIKNNYESIREPIWRNLNLKQGGLSKNGQKEFGGEIAVMAAAAALKAYLSQEGKAPNIAETIGKSPVDATTQASFPARDKGVSNCQVEVIASKEVDALTAHSIIEKAVEPIRSSDWSEDPRHEYVMVDTSTLKQNPLNSTIYSDEVPTGLIASVELSGVRVPIRVTPQMLILDGHLRTKAARETGWKKVPVIIEDVPEEQQLLTLLEFNRSRDKTNPERIREFRAYLSIERNLAADRSGLRTDCGVSLPPGHTDFGKARDLAAQKVGMSGSSAERGLKILEEIEKRQVAGELDGVPEVNAALIKSINRAYELSRQYGWLNSALKKSEKNAKADNLRKDDEHVVQENPNMSPPDDQVQGWLTDEILTDLTQEMGEEGEEVRRTLNILRPRLYMVSGRTPDKSKAAKLRLLAKAITTLADKYEELGN